MDVTISTVSRCHDAMQDFMRKQCALVAEYGGSFAVRDFYEKGCYTEYTIKWPAGLNVAEKAA